MRKLSQLIDNNFRDRVEVIVQDDKGNIMIGRNPKHKAWVFPGGGIEKSEDEMQTAIREVAEEAGVNVKPLRFLNKEPILHLIPDHLRVTYKHPEIRGTRTRYLLAQKINDELAKGFGADKDTLLENKFRPKLSTIDLLKTDLGNPDTEHIVKTRLEMLGLL